MKMHFTKMLSVCCAIVFGAFLTTDALAQGDCTNTTAFGSADITAAGPNGQLIGISTCSYTTEYSTITGVPAGEDIEFSLGNGGYITVRTDSSDGAVVAEGFSPVTVSAASGANLYPHWNLSDDCSGAAECVVTEVQCTTCPTICSGGNPGDSCDDGNPATVNDEIQADCSCLGDALASNDTPCTATAVACGDTLTGQSLAGATAFGGDGCGGTGVNDVYYSFTADGTQSFRIAVLDPLFLFDGVVELLEGPDCNTLSVSASCNDFPEEYSVTAAGNYIFRVRAWSETEVDGFDITLECTPFDCPGVGNIGDACDDGNPMTIGSTVQADCSCDGGFVPAANDECVDVASLLQCGVPVDGTTVGATVTTLGVLNNLCNGFTSGTPEDVWYAFSADGTSSYTVTVDTSAATASSLMDAVIFVYSGACGSLTEVSCADANFTGGAFSGESINLDTPATGIYYVRVFNWNAGGEPFTITLDCDDNCNDPFPAVDELSLSTTFTGSAYATAWDAVPGQVGCQIQVRLAGGATLGAQIIAGAGANGFNIPGSVLDAGTDYEWRVRCGCSQTPIIAGPFSSWQPFSTPGGAAISSMPNPTVGQSNVTFTVVEEGYTTLEVFDMSGRLVDAIFTGNAQANNEYRFEFDGSSLPNGVYIYRLTTNNEVVNDKFMIAK